MRAIGYALWSFVLPPIGIIAVIGLIVAFGYALWVRGVGYTNYLDELKSGVAKERISSPSGRFDLVVWVRNESFAEVTVVPAGEDFDHRQTTRGPEFWWSDDEVRNVAVAWLSDDTIEVGYCGVDVGGGNVLVAGDHTFDVQMVRRQDCPVTARGKKVAPLAHPTFSES